MHSAAQGSPEVHAGLIAQAGTFHSWDAMSPRALSAIARRSPFDCTAETGCGGSTIVFSQLGNQHIAFGIEGENRTITELRARSDLRQDVVVFVEGATKATLPAYPFATQLDLVLLDGPHAYPLPQLEYTYLFPHIKQRGWLVLDDLQIPSVHELFSFLCKERSVVLEEVIDRTAFFSKVRNMDAETGPDGWWLQGINHRAIWRYSWRDQFRKILGRGQQPTHSGPTDRAV
jgi:hypothetical protein